MVLEQSHFLFEKELIEEAKNSADGEGIIDFADPDNGMTIKFRGSATTYMGKASIEPKNFGFIDRDSPVGKLVKATIAFDGLLTMYTPDQMLSLMNGADAEEEEEMEEEAPPKKRPSKHDDEEEEEAPKKAPPKEEGPTCPHGHKFGKDNDEKPECEDCKVWKACARAAK
jgi:hypothetical protein